VLLIDAQRGIDTEVARLLDRVQYIPVPVILALNKVDLIQKDRLLGLTAELNGKMKFTATFMISALKGSGVEDLARFVAKSVPEGLWHYPEDDVTDAPARLIAAELTREQIYDRLHEELPYAITVETTGWKDMGKKKGVRIEQTIFVERDSQRSIVLGKDGATVKTISSNARTGMADIFGRPVHLFLFVKVREGWENDPERYAAMGLAFPKE
jgi:GTPase